MVIQRTKDFDLRQIADSGQCFRMKQLAPDQYSLIAFGKYLELEQDQDKIVFQCDEQDFHEIWVPYFDLNTDYGRFKNRIEKEDIFLQSAAAFGGGIRILRQELFEIIISFIISQRNNIPRIKKSVENLCRLFGEEKRDWKGGTYFTFPTATRLAKLKLTDLDACGLGYRNRYIYRTSMEIADGTFELQGVLRMDYEEARAKLLELCGVGQKVAECICLYSLHHVEAFPIDTHIKSILDEYYKAGFPFKRYEGFAGILQQYAFYYDLNHKKQDLEKIG